MVIVISFGIAYSNNKQNLIRIKTLEWIKLDNTILGENYITTNAYGISVRQGRKVQETQN